MPLHTSAARGVSLARVFPAGHWLAAQGPRIHACANDPQTLQPGDLFVALDDDEFTSQATLARATQRGAIAILAERPLPSPLPQFIVDDARQAHGTLCHALAGNPAETLRSIGIAGSFGKTTTEHLLAAILKAGGEQPHRLASSLIDQQGPAYLAKQLAQGVDSECTHAIIEASSQALASRQLHGTTLDAAIITNIHREHATPFNSLRNYQRILQSTFRLLKPDGFTVLNADDRLSQPLIAATDRPTLTFGIEQQADIMATILEQHPSEQTFVLDAGDESIVVRTRMIGQNHVYNCLAATAAALALHIDMESIVRGLESVTAIPSRLQHLACGQGFSLFVDGSATGPALAQTLKTVQAVCRGNLICVAGIDPFLEEAQRAELGRVLERHADRAVVTGHALDSKLSLRNAHDVLDGFQRPAQAHLMPSRPKAICWALSQARPGDTVLLVGGQPSLGPDDVLLCDEDVARFWLEQHGAPGHCPWLPA